MADQRLKGQEVSINVVQGGNVLETINSVSAFNDNVMLELKENGYLGEAVNRFDEVLNGFGGDFEFHVTTAAWNDLIEAIIDRATRATPDVTFNVVRIDIYPNSETSTFTYNDVNWGPVPTNVSSRGDYVKARMEFRCGERAVKNNSII